MGLAKLASPAPPWPPGQSRGRPPPKAELLLRRRRYRSPLFRAPASLWMPHGRGLLGSPNRPPMSRHGSRSGSQGRGGSSNGSSHHATRERLFALTRNKTPPSGWDDRRMTGALRTGLRAHKPPPTAIQHGIRPFTHRLPCAHLPPVPASLHSWARPEMQQPWSAQIPWPIISLCRHTHWPMLTGAEEERQRGRGGGEGGRPPPPSHCDVTDTSRHNVGIAMRGRPTRGGMG